MPLIGVRPHRRFAAERLKFVADESCLVCGRSPTDADRLRVAELRALRREVSDEFTAPLRRGHRCALRARAPLASDNRARCDAKRR
jgi:hypothetical protein